MASFYSHSLPCCAPADWIEVESNQRESENRGMEEIIECGNGEKSKKIIGKLIELCVVHRLIWMIIVNASEHNMFCDRIV